MGCRIGITTNLKERKNYWKEKYKYRNFRNWRIVRTFRTKTNAQNWENEEKKRTGCVAYSGGAGPEKATYYGYKFNFD